MYKRQLEDLTEIGRAEFHEGKSVPLIPFKHAADRFRMIEDGSCSIIVPDPAIAQQLHELRVGVASRGSMRRVARYSVSLYDNDVKALQSTGAIRLLDGDTSVSYTHLQDFESYYLPRELWDEAKGRG